MLQVPFSGKSTSPNLGLSIRTRHRLSRVTLCSGHVRCPVPATHSSFPSAEGFAHSP